jgi:hypothetical protein
MLDWQFLTGTVIIAAGFVWLLVFIGRRMRKSWRSKAEQSRQRALERAAVQHAAAQVDARKQAINDNIAHIRAAAEKAAARRLAAEQAAAERALAEKAAVDQALSEWIEAEEAEARKAAAAQAEQERTTTEHTETKRIVLDYALMEWFEKMQAEIEKAGEEWIQFQPKDKKLRKGVDAVKEQVMSILHQLDKETEDLEYIINKIRTGVDFLPLQVADTIEKWKKGEIYRNLTLSDLKLKFRYMAYSIDDGWALFYVYTSWIEKLRNKLFVFIRLLGTEPEEAEPILKAIDRAEQIEWKKYLKMNMDVIFILKEMRDIYQMTVNMEQRLQDLESVCKKRSEQIIKPVWDHKESL